MRYRIAIVTSFLFAILPVMIFIIAHYAGSGYLTVNKDTGFCETNNSWKFIFAFINIIYFICLLITVLMVPRYIKNQFFNESRTLIWIVVLAAIVFMLETWLGFRFRTYNYAVTDLSNSMIFQMHTFTIVSLMGFRLFMAMRANKEYAKKFNDSIEKTDVNTKFLVALSTNPDVRDDFINFCMSRYGKRYIPIVSNQNREKRHIIPVSNIIEFIKEVCAWEDKANVRTSANSTKNLVKGIITKYVYSSVDTGKNMIGLDGPEEEKLNDETLSDLHAGVLKQVRDDYIRKLYHAYYTKYKKNSSSLLQFFPVEKARRNVMERLYDIGVLKDDPHRDYNDLEIQDGGAGIGLEEEEEEQKKDVRRPFYDMNEVEMKSLQESLDSFSE